MILPSKYMLAPMAEISTPALRSVIREYSKDVILYSEMLSAGAIASGAYHNEPLIKKNESDDPLIYQIIGESPETMSRAAGMLSERGCFSIDINMGCPAPLITRKIQGARLLTDIDLARSIISACRKKCRSLLSVKMRSGYDNNDAEKLIEFALMLQNEGVDFITLHPRYAKLSFTRSADWRLVKLLKEKLTIPVIGNGDITGAETAAGRFIETGCDGVMIGREAVKNPWIFRLCNNYDKNRNEKVEINREEIFIKTMENIKNILPENLHKSRAHRFAFYFTKNHIFGHNLMNEIRREDSIDNILNIIKNFYKRNSSEIIKIY